jgi:hypothetical protein
LALGGGFLALAGGHPWQKAGAAALALFERRHPGLGDDLVHAK